MNTKITLIASILAATLVTGCSDDDDNNSPPPPVPNNAPVAADILSETESAVAIEIDVLAKATDADGDTLTITAAEAVKGQASIKDGLIHYDPKGFVGEDVIDYSISDGTDTDEAIVTVTVTETEVVLSYVGSDQCQMCHSQQYASHQKSGHNFKISKVENGEQPVFPYTDISGALELISDAATDDDNDGQTDNTLGAPTSYADVTYITGGYFKKLRWFDNNGHIVTGTDVQFNLYGEGDDVMSGYHDNDIDMMYDCGNCHNTGWRPYATGSYEHRQDDLAGMGGNFAFAGVQCEACHGAASEHVKAPSKDNITKVATPRTTASLQSDSMGYGEAMHCAECHTRDGNREGGDLGNNYVNGYTTAFPDGEEFGGRIAVKGGLPRHHQGHDEMMGIDPDTGVAMGKHYNAGMSCSSCHNPHQSTVNMGAADGLHDTAVKACSTCHAGKEMSDQGMLGLHASMDCTTCHMPEVVKNATSTLTKAGVTFGDQMIHTMEIDLFNDKGQITEDGKFMYPYLQDGFACGECHAEGSKLDRLVELGGKMHK